METQVEYYVQLLEDFEELERLTNRLGKPQEQPGDLVVAIRLIRQLRSETRYCYKSWPVNKQKIQTKYVWMKPFAATRGFNI